MTVFIGPAHRPRRLDALDVWIKAQRDCYDVGTDAWHALDDLRSDYRLLADQGKSIPEEQA